MLNEYTCTTNHIYYIKYNTEKLNCSKSYAIKIIMDG